jgi:hypothetical protein
MSLLTRRPLKDLVHQVVDVTRSFDSIDSPKVNRYAIQVGAALSRSRATGAPEAACDVSGHAPAK